MIIQTIYFYFYLDITVISLHFFLSQTNVIQHIYYLCQTQHQSSQAEMARGGGGTGFAACSL